MEVSYKKDMEKSYMLIKLEEELVADYQIKMVTRNVISSLCPLSIRQFNNDNTLYYDISGRTSVKSIYSRNKMSAQDIKIFVVGIQKMIESIKDYLLDLNKVIMDFDYIYMDTENNKLYFCYYPEKKEDFFTSLQDTFNRLIEVADHTDRETVIMSYGIHQLGSKESITITDLLKFVKESPLTENGAGENKKDRKKEEVRIESSKHSMPESVEMDKNSMNKADYKTRGKKRRNQLDIVKKIRETLLPKWDRYESMEDMELEEESVDKYAWETEEHGLKKELCKYNSDETLLLKPDVPMIGIILKSTDSQYAQTIIPNDFPCIIGKSKRNSDYIIECKTISRVHLKINETADGFYIEDLNSTNGSYLNGRRLNPYHPEKIDIGDRVKLAEIEYIVC